MIQRGQIFVRAKKKDGGYGSVDVFDLTEESFRCFVLTTLSKLDLFYMLTHKGDSILEYEEEG